MISRLLKEIKQANGPIMLSDLSRKLDVEPEALQGMIEFLIRKGRLQDDDGETAVTLSCTCSSASSNTTCAGTSKCAFIAKMPKSYTIPLRELP